MRKSSIFKVMVFVLLVMQMLSGILKPVYAVSSPVLTTTAVGTAEIGLNWTPVPDANLYELWRRVNDNPNFDLLATQSDINLSDNTVSAHNKYEYKVIAVASSVYSEPSNILTVYTDLTPPSIPTGFAVASTVNSVTLNWSASNDDWRIDKYEIYCKSGTQPFSRIGSATSTTFVHSNLHPNTTYYYYVKAVDPANLESGASSEISTTTLVDNEPPQAPAGLTANVVSNARIDLSWTQPSDNVGVVSYILYRSAPNTDGNYTEFTTNNTNYSFTDLLPGTRYYFKVKAKDRTGNVSGFSAVISTATRGDYLSPTPPVIWAQATSTSKIKLTWSGATDNFGVSGYDIYRDKGNTGSFSKISSSTSSSYYDSTSKDTIYSYYIVSKDAVGNLSDPSNTVIVKTNGDTQSPSQPGNLSATVADNDKVRLSWSVSTDNMALKGYKIYRGLENSGFTWITSTTNNYYNDTDLTAKKDYKYYIISYDEAGNESAASNTVTVYTSTDTNYEKTIEPGRGGTLTISGLVMLTIPGNALPTAAQYKMEQKSFSKYNTSGYVTFGQPVEITVRNGSTAITNFNKDLTLDFYYTTSALGTITSTKLGIYYWDNANRLWIAVPSDAYSSNGKVTSEIDHLTVFALLGDVTGPSVPTLSTPVTSSEQQITLTGSGEKNSKIDIMLNGSIISVTTNLKGNFTKNVTLVKGQNEIKLRAKDAAGNESNWSPVYVINYLAEGGLTDINNHWAENNIKRAVELGLTKGYENQTFQPNRNITRAEFCRFMVAALNYEPVSNPQLSFTDSGSIPAWSRGYIGRAVEKGLISGYSDGSFRANQEITRQEMAAIIVNAMNLSNEAKLKQNNTIQFRDAARIQKWARGSVIIAVESQIIKGYSDNTFRPTNTATRAEAVTMVINMIDKT